MAHIEWTNDLNLNISVIDKQHKRIVDYINQLYIVSDSQSKKEVKQVLDELVDYTLSHFAFEESLIEESGYVFVNGHKKVHQLFVKRVGELQNRFERGEEISDELLGMLRLWLINHIKNDDKDFADIVIKNMQDNSDRGSWVSRSLKRLFN